MNFSALKLLLASMWTASLCVATFTVSVAADQTVPAGLATDCTGSISRVDIANVPEGISLLDKALWAGSPQTLDCSASNAMRFFVRLRIMNDAAREPVVGASLSCVVYASDGDKIETLTVSLRFPSLRAHESGWSSRSGTWDNPDLQRGWVTTTNFTPKSRLKCDLSKDG